MENKQTNPPAAQENIMGTMAINPLLVKLSIPMMVSMLVQALYNVVDSIFVSHVSEGALTAVSLAFSLQNVMIAVGVGTGVGVNALLSKSLGEKDQERANKTAENGIFLALCSFAVFFIIGLTCSRSSVIVTDFSPNSRGRTQRYSAVFVCSAAGASFNVRISCEVCSKPVSMQTTSARTRIFLELMSRASAERTWQQACSCMAAVAAGSSTRMEYGK